MSLRNAGFALLVLILGVPAAAQRVTNEPVYLGEEGPSPLRRQYVAEIGPATLRWERTPEFETNPNTGLPNARSHVVVARWDRKACARPRGPFCAERGAWLPVGALRSEDIAEGRATFEVEQPGHYLVFGRSRLHPSRPNSWKIDMMLDDAPVADTPGARRMLFDTSPSVGGGVRYSVVVEPKTP